MTACDPDYNSSKSIKPCLACCLLLFLFISIYCGNAQQVPDTTYKFSFHQTAFQEGNGPVIYIDEAHHNFHTKNGGFYAFSRLLEQDGYVVKGLNKAITGIDLLEGCKILVIANALNEANVEDWVIPTPSAFSQEEISVLKQWVENGGSLLLIADHMPFAGAACELGKTFGFEFINGFAMTGEGFWPPSVFSVKNGMLTDSPVSRGLNAYEKIDSVTTFTGSAFKAPAGSANVLKFLPGQKSLQPDTAWRFSKNTPSQSLDGYSQGALLNFGKGKIAVFGEAAMFTAQVANGMKVGFNSDLAPQNTRFTLNLVHWLGGVEEYHGNITNARQYSATFPKLTGPYFDQKPPGMKPEIFAPGIISTGLNELNSVFTPDGREFYFCVRTREFSTIFAMKVIEGAWTKPETLPFNSINNDIDVSVSPDGKRLFFCSNRPVSGNGSPKKDYDIWFCRREGDSWGEPVHMPGEINSDRDDFYPIASNTGTLFFNSQRAGEGTNDIYCSRFIEGKYLPAEKLGAEINTEYREFDAYVDPDERLIIFTSDRPGYSGHGDLFASSKKEDGTWTAAKNLGTGINGPGPEFGSCISSDSKFFFFTRYSDTKSRSNSEPLNYDCYFQANNSPGNGSSDIWWVDAEFIREQLSKE
jgi:hypothetical protein